MSAIHFTWQSALWRAAIGTLGGFAAAISFMIGMAGVLIVMQWMHRADATVAAAMLAFPVWMSAVLVAFGAVTVWRAAIWVLGTGGGFALLGWGCLSWAGAS